MTVGIKDLRDKGALRLTFVSDWLIDLLRVAPEISAYVKTFPNLPVCLDVVKVRELVQLEWRYQGSTKRLRSVELDASASDWVTGKFLDELLRVNSLVVVLNAQLKLMSKVYEVELGFDNGWTATDLYELTQSATGLPQSVLDRLDSLSAI